MRAFAGASALLLSAALSLPAQQPNDSVRARVDRAFAQWSSREGPGCSAAASQDGKTIYEAGYGSANLEADVPITPSSIFHAASVSKQFTAMAVMLLVREGKLSLDADVHTYIPELPDYRGQRITLRHLLTHTSGLRDQWDLLAIARGRFEENRITQDDVLDIVTRQKALNFPPGAEYLYSNSGYTLAAIIVSRVAGMPMRQFAEERIFKPLGMTRTHFHDDYTMVVKGRTSAYERRRDGQWHVSIPNFDTYGATSLFTTVGDLLKWQENFRRPVVGDTALLRAMQTNAILTNGDTVGYGLGLTLGGAPGMRMIGHNGADAGYRAMTGRYPDQGFAISVLCNAASADPSGLATKASEIFLGKGLPELPSPVALQHPPPPEQLARYTGLYVHPVTGDVTYVSLKDRELIVGRTSGPALVPVGDSRFWLPGQRIEWTFQPNGSVVQTYRRRLSQHPVTLVRHDAVRPSAAELAQYAGDYTSPELGATYTVSVADTALSFRTGITDAWTAGPTYTDAFDGQVQVEFTRDPGGRLTGLQMSTGRVRRVWFEKVR